MSGSEQGNDGVDPSQDPTRQLPDPDELVIPDTIPAEVFDTSAGIPEERVHAATEADDDSSSNAETEQSAEMQAATHDFMLDMQHRVDFAKDNPHLLPKGASVFDVNPPDENGKQAEVGNTLFKISPEEAGIDSSAGGEFGIWINEQGKPGSPLMIVTRGYKDQAGVLNTQRIEINSDGSAILDSFIRVDDHHFEGMERTGEPVKLETGEVFDMMTEMMDASSAEIGLEIPSPDAS